jgi:hypothetical protein
MRAATFVMGPPSRVPPRRYATPARRLATNRYAGGESAVSAGVITALAVHDDSVLGDGAALLAAMALDHLEP